MHTRELLMRAGQKTPGGVGGVEPRQFAVTLIEYVPVFDAL